MVQDTTTLLRVMCHEFRTPITAVRALARALTGPAAQLETDQRLTAARLIVDHAEHLAAMLEAVRVVAEHMPVTAQPPRPATVRLADLVAGAADAAGVVGLEVDIAPTADTVAVDATTVRRILTNLLENARRHGRAPIALSATRHGRQLRVVVTDSGPGMPAEVVTQVIHGGAPAMDGSGGLGLWIVTQLVAMLRGTVRAGANQPRGARVEVMLPLLA